MREQVAVARKLAIDATAALILAKELAFDDPDVRAHTDEEAKLAQYFANRVDQLLYLVGAELPPQVDDAA